MNLIQLLAILVGQLALIAKDPALGERGEALTEALALLSTLIVRGEAARAELEVLTAHVQAMVADGNRAPELGEYQALRDLSKQYHDILNPTPPAANGD